jgi:pimeloyl-ACP methyl ester carboxylesterase
MVPSASYGQSSFYWPKQGAPAVPKSRIYTVTKAEIPNGDAVLASWVFEPKAPEVRGTVVYCHGNAGNMEHHVGFMDFLPAHGFRVVMFDYQGFGESSPNKPTRESTVSDVNAVLDSAENRWGTPWLMGQSLGCVAGDCRGR